MKSWSRIQQELFIISLWRLAGSRATMIELAETWQLPGTDAFLREVDELARQLEKHIRDQYRAIQRR